MTLDEQIKAVLDRMDFGTATAAKRGRDPAWPYVPIIQYAKFTKQVRNRAFTTRQAAIDCAQGVVDKARETAGTQFKTPRYRAFRQQWGLPTEIGE